MFLGGGICLRGSINTIGALADSIFASRTRPHAVIYSTTVRSPCLTYSTAHPTCAGFTLASILPYGHKLDCRSTQSLFSPSPQHKYRSPIGSSSSTLNPLLELEGLKVDLVVGINVHAHFAVSLNTLRVTPLLSRPRMTSVRYSCGIYLT